MRHVLHRTITDPTSALQVSKTETTTARTVPAAVSSQNRGLVRGFSERWGQHRHCPVLLLTVLSAYDNVNEDYRTFYTSTAGLQTFHVCPAKMRVFQP